MKLLLDADISWRLYAPLSEHFGVCNQVNRIALNPPSKGSEIWHYAQQNGYTIVTHDFDFLNLPEVYGYPPRVILLKTGNIDSKKTLGVLLQAKQSIGELHQKDYELLEIMKGNIYE